METNTDSKPNFIDDKDPVRVLGFLQAGATLNLTMHGEVRPLFFIFTESDMVPVVPDFSDAAAKEESFELARKTARELGAWAFAVVCEAWLSKGTETQLDGLVIALYTTDGLSLRQLGTVKGHKVEWELPQVDVSEPSFFGREEAAS